MTIAICIHSARKREKSATLFVLLREIPFVWDQATIDIWATFHSLINKYLICIRREIIGVLYVSPLLLTSHLHVSLIPFINFSCLPSFTCSFSFFSHSLSSSYAMYVLTLRILLFIVPSVPFPLYGWTLPKILHLKCMHTFVRSVDTVIYTLVPQLLPKG